jgi:type II secretory pathway pseudopilin PulG
MSNRIKALVVSNAGLGLLEVLVTTLVVGIAAVGIALMYSVGNTNVVAKGDNRVALGLAQQKIEQLRSLTFNCIPVSGPTAAVPSNPLPCTATQNYSEGAAWVTATGVAAPAPSDRAYARLTCVQYVDDLNFNSPAYAGGVAGTPCPAFSLPLLGPTNTKRITVIVTPAQREADPVILQAWITPVGP